MKRFQVRYVHSLFTQITLLTAIMILILSWILYSNFKTYTLEQLYTSNEKQMKQIFTYAIQGNDYVKNYANSLFSHPDTMRLMLENNLSQHTVLSSIKALDASLSGTSFVRSAYIYNSMKDTYYILGPNPAIRTGNLFDQDIVQLLDNLQFQTLVPIPRKMPYAEWKQNLSVETYSYIIPRFVDKGEKINGALVLNIDAEWLFHNFITDAAIEDKHGNMMFILDSNGTIIGHQNRELFLHSLSGQPYVDQLLTSGHPSGYFVADVNGEPSVITYASFDNPQWTMVSITPYVYITEKISKVRAITFSIGFIVFIVGILAVFILSRKLYAPINMMRQQINRLLDRQPDKVHSENEFDFISQSFASTHKKMKLLEEFKQQNMHHFKQAFLKEVLLNPSLSTGTCDELFKTYHIQMATDQPFTLLILKIDRYSEFCAAYTESERSLMKFALMNISKEMFIPQFECEGIDIGGDHIAILLNGSKENEKEHESIKEIIQKIDQAYSDYCAYHVSAAISRSIKGIKQVPNLYRLTLEHANYRILYGHRSIMSQEEIEAKSYDDLNIDDTLLQSFLGAIKSANENDIQLCLEQLIQQMKAYRYSDLMFSLSFLTSSIFNTLLLIEKNSSIRFNKNFAEFDSLIKSRETLEAIREELILLFQHIVQTIRTHKDEKSITIVTHAVQYIESHYQDFNLSPNTIADKLQLTTAYMNKLFREHTSYSISDYITNVRLTHAKRMLLDTQHNISDILDHVGWENKKYFSTIFKKHTGVTPSEFRLKGNVTNLYQSTKKVFTTSSR